MKKFIISIQPEDLNLFDDDETEEHAKVKEALANAIEEGVNTPVEPQPPAS